MGGVVRVILRCTCSGSNISGSISKALCTYNISNFIITVKIGFVKGFVVLANKLTEWGVNIKKSATRGDTLKDVLYYFFKLITNSLFSLIVF